MIQKIYLHPSVKDTLTLYGSLDIVTNRILEALSTNGIDITSLPPAPPRDGCAKYSIDITNEEFVTLFNANPKGTNNVSVRRALYYFVENELYNELGWKISENVITDSKNKIRKDIREILSALNKLNNRMFLSHDDVNELHSVIEIIKRIGEHYEV